jgi:hypothetical protein
MCGHSFNCVSAQLLLQESVNNSPATNGIAYGGPHLDICNESDCNVCKGVLAREGADGSVTEKHNEGTKTVANEQATICIDGLDLPQANEVIRRKTQW